SVFALSAMYGSLAGSIYAHYINFIAPATFYITTSILLLVMVMVGGVHSIWGGVLGAATITFLNEAIRFIGHTYFDISGDVEIVDYGLIIVLVIIFMSKGLITLCKMFKRKTVLNNDE